MEGGGEGGGRRGREGGREGERAHAAPAYDWMTKGIRRNMCV